MGICASVGGSSDWQIKKDEYSHKSYPILYRLNDSGYISFFEKKVGRRQTRIYYHLEDNGLMYLDNLQTSFQQYVNLIQFLLTSKEGETYEEKTG